MEEKAERLLKKAEDAKTASEAFGLDKSVPKVAVQVARISTKHNATVVVLDSRTPPFLLIVCG